jgi:hypothetical protein
MFYALAGFVGGFFAYPFVKPYYDMVVAYFKK